MAAYFREELSMLMQSLLSYSADLLNAVCIAEIEDAYRDLATELLTVEM